MRSQNRSDSPSGAMCNELQNVMQISDLVCRWFVNIINQCTSEVKLPSIITLELSTLPGWINIWSREIEIYMDEINMDEVDSSCLNLAPVRRLIASDFTSLSDNPLRAIKSCVSISAQFSHVIIRWMTSKYHRIWLDVMYSEKQGNSQKSEKVADSFTLICSRH